MIWKTSRSRGAAFNSTKNSENQNHSEIPVVGRQLVQSFESEQMPPPVCHSSVNVEKSCEEEPLTRVQSRPNNTDSSSFIPNSQKSAVDIMGLSQVNVLHGSRRTRSKKS